jgi:hypothetical protein
MDHKTAFSIPECCPGEGVSRSQLYNEWRTSGGPRWLKRGRRRLISADEYRRQLEAEARADTAITWGRHRTASVVSLKVCTRRGDVVVDTVSGSGTCERIFS